MRSKFTNFILFIIMILLIATIAIFTMVIYANIKGIKTEDVIYTINAIYSDIVDENENNETSSNKETHKDNQIIENIDVQEVELNNENGNKYYYNQLTENQKKIYDGLLENKKNMYNGTYKIQYGGIFTDLLKEEGGSKKLGQDYQSAVETFLYDNPDVFYIDANKLFLSVETSTTLLKKTYNVYIGPAENETYYSEGFTSENQVKSAIKKIEDTRDMVLGTLTENTYKNVLKIHDYIVDNVKYDSNYTSIGTYSIYGALIDKKSVCEGYAKALKYLLDAAKIPCVIAQGSATNSTGKVESHAWNCVNLAGKWYYIDATWNDPIIIGEGKVAKSIQYKYFLKGAKTFNKDHVLSYKFSDGGRIYRYPSVQEYDYE